jgi:GTPase
VTDRESRPAAELADAFADESGDDSGDGYAFVGEGATVDDPEGPVAEDAPVVAVVGRPNVGKSTLVNRILGRRAAVVEDVPGVTRDRVTYDADWRGRRFTLVDTGGWDPDAKGFMARVAAQAEIAVAAADVVLFVVDVTVGATDVDEAVVRVLRRAGHPDCQQG